MRSARRALLVGLSLSLGSVTLVGCSHRQEVDLLRISDARTGQTISGTEIVLGEGQAVAFSVIPREDDQDKPDWSVSAGTRDRDVLSVEATPLEKVFVVVGLAAGDGEVIFILDGSHDVNVPVTVVPRDDFDPSVSGTGGLPSFDYPGLGGLGGGG